MLVSRVLLRYCTVLSISHTYSYTIYSILSIQYLYTNNTNTNIMERAEDWDLANPLKTCKLTVERLDDSCLVKLVSETIRSNGVGVDSNLFAQSIITITETQKLQSYLEFVVDSSRYFVVKIDDGKRSAHIGVGFRERDDASNFRFSLQEYERSIMREKKAEAMHTKYEEETANNSAAISSETEDSDQPLMMPQVSKLTLKEGETIRITLKGHELQTKEHHTSNKKSTGGAVPLLKKPPTLLLKKPPSSSPANGEEVTAAAAVAAAADNNDDDDDEWNDFQES